MLLEVAAAGGAVMRLGMLKRLVAAALALLGVEPVAVPAPR